MKTPSHPPPLQGEGHISIRNLTKSPSPLREALLSRIKNDILGENYELSLVFIGSARSWALNKKHRQKDKPANVLSFPLTENSGEVFIDPKEAAKGAPKFGMLPEKFLKKLFIHSLLHLKGFDHGGIMESEEEKFMAKFAG